MKLLGIDFGRKKIGLAFSEGLLASPLTVISVKTKKAALWEIANITERLAIEKIILGLPGGVLDKEIRSFANALTKQTGISVDFVDETLTSKEAITKMVEGKTTRKKRRLLEDAVAAALILNTYLENQAGA